MIEQSTSSDRLRRALRLIGRALRGRIAAWVAAAFLLLLALQALLVYGAVTSVQRAAAAFRHVVEINAPAAFDAYELKATVQNRIILMLRMAAEPDPFEREDDALAFEAQRVKFDEDVRELQDLALDAATREQLERVLRATERLSGLQRPIVEALRGGDDGRARTLLRDEPVFERQREVVAELQRLVAMQEATLRDALRRTQAEEAAARRNALLLGAALLVLGTALGVTVTRATARAADALERKRRAAEAAALVDPLTGLLNRRGLERELARWCRPGRASLLRHGLLVIDLDRFKAVNDGGGHDAGDELLRCLASVMLSCVRPNDRVARVGGDEFVVLLNEMDGDAALAVAQRLRDAIGEFEFVWDGRRYRVGASIGVAALRPGDGADACAAARAAADAACYRAKREGRNRVCVADDAGAA